MEYVNDNNLNTTIVKVKLHLHVEMQDISTQFKYNYC